MDSLIYSNSRLVATSGLEDIAVIDTPDALLVAERSRSQEVKKIIESLEESSRTEFEFGRTVYRPWGYYTVLENNKHYKVKRLTIYPGKSISYQLHHHRAEHWIMVKGTARVTVDGKERFVHENESTYVPKINIAWRTQRR